jgi:hypothetical protein
MAQDKPKLHESKKLVQEQVFSPKQNELRSMSLCGMWGFPLVKHFNTRPCPSRNNRDDSKPTKIDESKQNGGGKKQEREEHKTEITRHNSWSESRRTRWGKGLTSHLDLEYTDFDQFIFGSQQSRGRNPCKAERKCWLKWWSRVEAALSYL